MKNKSYFWALLWFTVSIVGQAVVIYSLDKNILSKQLPHSWIEIFKQHTKSPKNYSRDFNNELYEAIKRLSTENILQF